MKRRTLVLLLVLCMVVSLLPVTGHAAREQHCKLLVKVENYDYMGDFVSYWDCTYNENGQPLKQRSMLHEDGKEDSEYASITHVYDADGVEIRAEGREGFQDFTETYTYEQPKENATRVTKVRTPGDKTTVTYTEFDGSGKVVYESVTENGVLSSEYRPVTRDGILYEATTHYYHGEGEDSRSLNVDIYDLDTGVFLADVNCDDLDQITVTKVRDAQGAVTEISVENAYAPDWSGTKSYFENGRLTRQEGFFEGRRTTRIFDESGNLIREEFENQETHVHEYDADGYVTKDVYYDFNGDVGFTAIYTYQELVIPASPTFADVPVDAYYFDAVEWAVENGITNGTGKTTFSPLNDCTRGQVVTFLWRAKGCPEPKSTVSPFDDVPADTYYYKAVLWANEEGITNGTGAKTFSPEAPCTRAHVVTFLWRAENKPAAGDSNPFTDVPAGQYYTDAVLWAVSREITNGTSRTTFSPDSTCTRAQIVTFLYRDMA